MTAISWQSEVDAALEAGDCIILNINNSFTNGGHYVCCYGKDNDGYYISDSRGFTNGYAFDTPYSY